MLELDEFQRLNNVIDSKNEKVEYTAALKITQKGILVKKFVTKLGVVPSEPVL
jgi:hypothetical protein